jgi:hypothetical protein
MSEIVKILGVDTGKEPIQFEKLEISNENPALIKKTILEMLNRMGKNAHALCKFRNKFFVCDHTAKRGPSSVYVRSEVRYHPYIEELLK